MYDTPLCLKTPILVSDLDSNSNSTTFQSGLWGTGLAPVSIISCLQHASDDTCERMKWRGVYVLGPSGK